MLSNADSINNTEVLVTLESARSTKTWSVLDHSRSFRNSQHNSHDAHFATKGLEAIKDSSVQNTETPSFLIKIILLQMASTGDCFNRVSEGNILLHNMIIKIVIFKLHAKN